MIIIIGFYKVRTILPFLEHSVSIRSKLKIEDKEMAEDEMGKANDELYALVAPIRFHAVAEELVRLPK